MKMVRDLKERWMNLFKPLFLRYLLRQQLLMVIILYFVCTLTTIAVWLATTEPQKSVMWIILLVTIIVIWFFPLYLCIITFLTFLSFKKERNKISKEKELFDKVTNKIVREMVVKQGIKVNIFSDKKTDFKKFNNAINEEIKFQRKNIEILKENS